MTMHLEDPFVKLLQEMNAPLKQRKAKSVEEEDSIESLRYELCRKEGFLEMAAEMERNKALAFRMIEYDIAPNITRYGDESNGPGSVEYQALWQIGQKEGYLKRIKSLHQRNLHWTSFKDTLSEEDKQVLESLKNGSNKPKTVRKVRKLLNRYATKEAMDLNKKLREK